MKQDAATPFMRHNSLIGSFGLHLSDRVHATERGIDTNLEDTQATLKTRKSKYKISDLKLDNVMLLGV
jgi:hypothetical protein